MIFIPFSEKQIDILHLSVAGVVEWFNVKLQEIVDDVPQPILGRIGDINFYHDKTLDGDIK